jgi:hypothetical protein
MHTTKRGDALAANHVRDAPEEQRADGGGKERRGFYQALFNFADVPHRLEQGHDDADDEEIIGVRKESHAGDKHDLPVLFGDTRVVHFGTIIFSGIYRHGHGVASTLTGCKASLQNCVNAS